MNRKVRSWLPAVAGLAVGATLLLAGSGCSKKAEAPAAPRVPVTVAKAQKRDVPVELKGFGTVEPFASITVKAQVPGTIMEVLIKEGDHVKANQPLLRIDKRLYEAIANRLEANLSRDTVNAQLSRHESEKLDGLLKKGVATPDEVVQAKSKADADDATVNADKAELESARLSVSFCDITSPIDGVAGKLDVNQGNVIKAYDVNIITINQIQPVYVSFTLPHQYLGRIRQYSSGGEGLPVRAQVPGDGEEMGVLSFIDNAVDAASGTIRLRGTFDNASEHLWPGQFVNVTLVLTTQKDCVVVPVRAVQTGQQGSFVFVVKPDQSVEVRPVKPGLSLDGMVAVDGVQEGETVVTDGQLRLISGAKIRVMEPASQPASQPATALAEKASQ